MSSICAQVEMANCRRRLTNPQAGTLGEPFAEPSERVLGSKTELVRTFYFHNSSDAIDFMARTPPSINDMDHHPRWENVYRTLIVRVTTWDIKHQLSYRDAVLARYLEKTYNEYIRKYGPPPLK